MAKNWVGQGELADMKSRLDKLRASQSRYFGDEEPTKKDTLKILQSKFGSPVYDPSSPLQKAYERRCARSGRRKSIEFEDLYITKGSGALHLPPSPSSPKSRPGSSASRKHPLLRASTSMHLSHSSGPTAKAPDHKVSRVRKSSDPTNYKKADTGNGNVSGQAKTKQTGSNHKVQGEHGSKGQSHKSLLNVTLSEEDKKIIDQKLAGIGGCENRASDGQHPARNGSSPQQQRRRKISAPSKIGSKH